MSEKTFRSFNRDQGANYAENRRDYHPTLYKILLDYHRSNGAQFDTILDVGTGPGIAIRTLAPQFQYAIGLDPSEGMIETARSLGGESGSSEPIRFEVSTAEDLVSIKDESVDLLIAATAAHWFDMAKVWPRAAQVLKPGGTFAVWSSGSIRVDPSIPGQEGVQAALDWQEELLDDYMTPGNRLTRDLYRGLPLPWDLSEPLPAFDKSSFVRKEWGVGGDSLPGEEFYAMSSKPVNLDILEMILGTGSPVIRWREAHPDAVGTEADCVRLVRRRIEKALKDAGVDPDKAVLKGSICGVILMVKKTS
jgi:SAM-dependent methyltransferase